MQNIINQFKHVLIDPQQTPVLLIIIGNNELIYQIFKCACIHVDHHLERFLLYIRQNQYQLFIVYVDVVLI